MLAAHRRRKLAGTCGGKVHESGLDEGQIYGVIFIEDSADGCVSVSSPSGLSSACFFTSASCGAQRNRYSLPSAAFSGSAAAGLNKPPVTHWPRAVVVIRTGASATPGTMGTLTLYTSTPGCQSAANSPTSAAAPALRGLHGAADGAAAEGPDGARVAAVVRPRDDEVEVRGREAGVEEAELGAACGRPVDDQPAVQAVVFLGGLVLAADGTRAGRRRRKGGRAPADGGEGLADGVRLADPGERTVWDDDDGLVARLVQGGEEGREVGRDGGRGPVVVDELRAVHQSVVVEDARCGLGCVKGITKSRMFSARLSQVADVLGEGGDRSLPKVRLVGGRRRETENAFSSGLLGVKQAGAQQQRV
ncbi:hypothetical protein CKAH01_12917 [Colletotrichum kahawae]|uniref:Uncharacterized protein n=1 Tax=Colletotrichum kahawae TaxID=34407 RepID=A0AAE0DAJ2_COLKA|nr:hypothetical protein CKAH01_12917 [Colletotrichum kahawae]